ncbi:uncharacterized protein LOC107009083 isoform X1 [Solanum pennellii]|uniref:Uncharacterized protein LOC107009083 isoform X1 n=2 Tax=Solanum pennellii TaxID=28526 RepID=A0ABM1FZK2_SOLPN|nr:uncharacterized protein LOC107009083 isoform X1 [Solanum pennellii]
MGVIVESNVWEPNPALCLFFFTSCCLSIYYLPSSTRSSAIFDHAPSSSFIRFQRSFLLLYSLSSVMEGLLAVFGEYDLAFHGISREQMVISLCVGYATALFVGTFLGMLSDLIGQRKVSLLFCLLHLFVAVWRRVTGHPSIWLASICLSLASTIFFFNFETWMVVEHDKLEQRQDSVNDMFWLMTFVESASFIGSQVVGNWLIGGHEKTTLLAPSSAVVIMALSALAYVSRGWKEDPKSIILREYQTKFHTYIISDKRVWLLSWTQATMHFSIAVFWITWAPTIVADGRGVLLGLVYPCVLGAKMLGSTAFSWFSSGPLSLRTEECLVYACIIMGFVTSVVAFDYQDVEILLMLFCIFHVCVGLVLPSLARLRTMYVPNDLRGGMMSLSIAPSNALMLFLLIQRGFYQNIENSTIIAMAALGLFSAAGCMYMLKRLGKQPHQNWHKL